MRLITETELAGRTDAELALLFQMVSQALTAARPGTPARRAVISSLQNISSVRRKPSSPQHAAGDSIHGIGAAGCPAAVTLPVRARPAVGRLLLGKLPHFNPAAISGRDPCGRSTSDGASRGLRRHPGRRRKRRATSHARICAFGSAA